MADAERSSSWRRSRCSSLALVFSSSSAYGAPEAKPPTKAAKHAKQKPKVKAGIRRGQLNVLGTAGNDRITLRLKPGNKSRLQVDVGGNGSAEFTFKRSAFNRIVVHGASGADALSINESYGVFTGSEATSLFGDTGNDLLRSGSAAERLFGGIGNDTIDGKRGNDLIEGGAGSDLVVFNGSNAAEKFEFSANGKRLRFVGASTMNIAGVERFDLRASGGADNVVVNDLSRCRARPAQRRPGERRGCRRRRHQGLVGCKRAPGRRRDQHQRHRGGGQRPPRAGRERQAEPRSRRGQRPRHGRGHGRKRHDRRRSLGGRPTHRRLRRSGGPADRRRQRRGAGRSRPSPATTRSTAGSGSPRSPS